MNAIKEYKELCYLTTYDNEVYVMADETIESIERKLDSKLLNVGDGFIAVASIKKVEFKTADDVDNAIIQIKNPDLKERVRAEIRNRKAQGLKVNLAILENVIAKFS
jgi:hypothetical protein